MGHVQFSKLTLLTFLCLCLFTGKASANDPPLPTPVGRVVWVNGQLNAIMENKETRRLQKTSVIYLHDTLTTDSRSQAQIIFSDQSLMTFRESTKFYIDQYEYKPQQKGPSIGKYVMNLLAGGFRTITGLIAKKNYEDYQVNTPVATIGVRGTDYAVVLQNGQLKMVDYSGSPCLKSGAVLCLSKEKPYGAVKSIGVAPVFLNEQPIEFQEKLTIVPATISFFPSNVAPPSTNGTISSFCITQ